MTRVKRITDCRNSIKMESVLIHIWIFSKNSIKQRHPTILNLYSDLWSVQNKSKCKMDLNLHFMNFKDTIILVKLNLY